MKIRDRDLNKIKIDKYLNEFVWARGIKHPPAKVKVRARMDGEVVRVELADMTEHLKFKKARLAKRDTKVKPVGHKKAEVEKPEQKTEEEKKEEKEKKSAVVEAGQAMEKAAAKQQKKQTKLSKQPKAQPRRMSLEK